MLMVARDNNVQTFVALNRLLAYSKAYDIAP
jgi:hypothetical protein